MTNLLKKLAQAGRKKITYLLIALVSLVIVDGLLTQYLVPKGAAREANPFLEPLVGQTGFMVLKIVGALLCAFILWDVYRRFPRVGMIAAWIAVLGYGAIVIWNTSLILLT
jgi:hypothetical protein